ncbi:MAG: DUF2867 domain-containing protein [Deinococcota bacterium]|nr:DUF2867 domain-containing protein [Deinococcota bacterium]
MPKIDYADAHRIQVEEHQVQSIDALTRALFATAPEWIKTLLRLRNVLGRPFGLKTAYEPTAVSVEGELKPGTRVGLFQVFDRTAEEVLMGEDDRHLDFRVSVRLEREQDRSWAVVSTVVRFNNRLGRLYFVPVRPFHGVIVPAMMRLGLAKQAHNTALQ